LALSCLVVAVRPQDRTAERKIAALAARSHGVVTRAELVGAGVTPAEIKQRLGTGALLRRFPSVFRVGHAAPSLRADYLAAVRACGHGALLCGQAAAHVYGIVKTEPSQPEVLTRTERRIDGVKTGFPSRRCHGQSSISHATSPQTISHVRVTKPRFDTE